MRMRSPFLLSVVVTMALQGAVFGQGTEAPDGAYVAVLMEIGGGVDLFIGPSRVDPEGFTSRAFVERLLPHLHEKGMSAAYCPPGCLRDHRSPRSLHVVLSEATRENGTYWITATRTGGFGDHPEAGWLIEEKYLVAYRDGAWRVLETEDVRISQAASVPERTAQIGPRVRRSRTAASRNTAVTARPT